MQHSPDRIATARKAILIVNASPETASVVAKLLSDGTWDIENAPTNQAALTLSEKRAFDVVLTSEETCAADDIELLRRIRRLHPHTRVIILAPSRTPANVIAAIREHAFSYFTAPFEREELKDMLRIAMEAPPWDDGIELRSATPDWIRLFARCDCATADRLVQFINEIAEDLALDEKASLSSAFREMLMNAMEHGGRFDPDEYVEISYLRSSRAVSCRIRDPGEGFSFEEIPHAAVSNPPESPLAHIERREAKGLRPGGFGILLARKFVDEVIYNEKGNEVILIKHLDKPRTRDAAADSPAWNS
jgi:CheY-like chemotaxis protein